jgi:hypothetical protein
MNKRTVDRIIVGVFFIIVFITLEGGVFAFTWLIFDIANEWWEPSPTTSEVLNGMVMLHLNCGILIVFGVMAVMAGGRIITAFQSVFPRWFDEAGHDDE